MSLYQPRTDLAVEAREIHREQGLRDVPGIGYFEGEINGFKYQIMDIKDPEASKELGKPVGKYCTIEIDPYLRREKDGFENGVETVASLLKEFLPEDAEDKPALLAGLGNRAITPDAIGPLVLESSLVTRHLKQSLPEDFKYFRDVSAVAPGVLGTSGIESSSYVKSVAFHTSPSFIIAIDALAARDLKRLCRTIQITDTGITPGSGVGNSRTALNEETVGVPIVALGVPTVVDIRTVISDLGVSTSNEFAESNQMIVTPRNIDSDVSSISRLIGYAINMALHDGLTIGDIDMLLG